MFDGGGTLAMLFKSEGATSHSNQYMYQNGWGGGWNNLWWMYPISGEDYTLRFRQHWSGSLGEWYIEDEFDQSEWLLFMIVYDNGSTSNNAKFYWKFSGSNDENTNPPESNTPSGSLRAMSANYPAIGMAKNGNVPRPFKAKIAGFAAWDSVLSGTNLDNVRATFGSTYAHWSDYDQGNCIFYHNFDSSYVSGTTISPVYGGSNYNLTAKNGATFTSSGKPW
jgi:hypothetical protein